MIRHSIYSSSLSLLFGLAILGHFRASAQIIENITTGNTMDEEKQTDEAPSNPRFNLPTKTAGGTQMWTDFRNHWGYRVQQNALTGHFRLLDPENVRLTWGSKSACVEELDRLNPEPPDEISDRPRHTVVMLHGLIRTRHCMKSLEELFLEQDQARHAQQANASDDTTNLPAVRTIRYSYSSTRRSIGENAAALRELLEHQPSSDRFSFVGHSMGNIVVRHLIGDLEAEGDPFHLLPRMEAMVMLGPPNQGAAIARRLAPTKLYGWITGTGGLELGPQWEAFSERLATPKFPFLIIAGDVSDRTVQNPLVDGAGDFVVSLEEATLEGAEKIETVPLLHSFLMDDSDVTHRIVEYIESKWSKG